MSRGWSNVECQMVFPEADLSEVEKIPAKEVAMDVGRAEADLEVERAEIGMGQPHRMEPRDKESSRRGLENDLRASQQIDAQSGADPTAEKGSSGSGIKMGIDVNRKLRLSRFGDLTAQARCSLSVGIVRVLELMFVGDGRHGHIPILTTPGCAGSTKNT